MISYISLLGLMTLTVLVFAGLGVVYSRGKIEGMDDFITARGSTGTKMLSATMMASFLGVFLLFTPPEAGILGGLPAIIGYAMGVASLYIAFIVLGKRIRAYLPEGSLLTDYAFKRYGPRMYGLTVILSLFYMIVHLVAELTAIGLVAHQLAEIPLFYTAILVGLGTVIYTAYGGLRASIFTDLIQMLLVILLLMGITVGTIYYGGGIKTIFEHVSMSQPQLISFKNWPGIQYGITLCIAVFAANLFHQGYWQRIYAGKDQSSLRKSLIISIVLVIPVMIITGILGIVAAGQLESVNPSVALFSLAYSLFPKGLIVALFILALVLVMSTVDTLLNGIVATLTIDGMRITRTFKKGRVLSLARVLTILLIFPVALIASRGYSVLYLFFVADLVCAGVFFPLFFGLVSPHSTDKTALIAAILGIGSGIPFFMAGKLLLSFSIPVIVSGGLVLVTAKYIKNKTNTQLNN